MKPRVLLIAASSRGIGGVETWITRFVTHLKEHAWPVRVAMLRGQSSIDPDQFRRHHPGVVDLEIDGRGLTREGRIRAITRTIRKEQPTIVLPLSSFDAFEAVCREKLRQPELRLVVHAQANIAAQLADLRHYRDWWDVVVCPGKLTQRWLTGPGGLPKEIVEHVPNGADPPIAPRIGTDGRLRIGFVGRLTQMDKRAGDLPPIIEAATKRGVVANWSIVGDGPLAKELQSSLRHRSDVAFHGAVPPQQVYRDIYPQLDLLLFTSDSEAFGIALAEAMRHGVVPVVSRYLGWASERLVVDGHCGLSFPVGDHRQAAERISQLAADRQLLDKLSANAVQQGDRYTWERSLSSWREALKSAASSPARRGAAVPTIPKRYAGRLDSIPLPTSWIESLRWLRQRLAPVPIPIDGEEWPLFGQHHDAAELTAIVSQLRQLELHPNGQSA